MVAFLRNCVFFRDGWIYYDFERNKGSGYLQHLQQAKKVFKE